MKKQSSISPMRNATLPGCKNAGTTPSSSSQDFEVPPKRNFYLSTVVNEILVHFTFFGCSLTLGGSFTDCCLISTYDQFYS